MNVFDRWMQSRERIAEIKAKSDEDERQFELKKRESELSHCLDGGIHSYQVMKVVDHFESFVGVPDHSGKSCEYVICPKCGRRLKGL